jgi:hypothetical protein
VRSRDFVESASYKKRSSRKRDSQRVSSLLSQSGPAITRHGNYNYYLSLRIVIKYYLAKEVHQGGRGYKRAYL